MSIMQVNTSKEPEINLEDRRWKYHGNKFRTQNVTLGVYHVKMVMFDLKSI